MRKLESNERYYVTGMWDGANNSAFFTNKEKAYAYARSLVRNVRWTNEELKRAKKECSNYIDISIALVEINEDDYIEWTEDHGSIASFEINENTVDRLY